MNDKTKKSTWRQKSITIQAGSMMEITFPDTKPNYFHINNLGAGRIFFGADFHPNRNIYDMEIGSYGENLYGQETGRERVYLYNDGATENLLKLTTFEHDFEPSSIKPSTTNVTGGTGGGGGDTVIAGFSVPLPAGANNIGRVVVTEMPTQNISFTSLPSGTNNIGRVNVDTLPPLAEGVSHIGTVTVGNGLTITDMPPVTVQNFGETSTNHTVFDGDVTNAVTTIDLTANPINQINYISNDSDTNDLYISFTNATVPAGNGLNGTIRLRPNESIENIPRRTTVVYLRRDTGLTGIARFLGV